MNARAPLRCTVLGLALAAGVGAGDVATGPAPAVAPERLLVDALQRVAAGDLDGALAGLDALIARTPNFKLAHLARGDVLMARAGTLGAFGAAPRADDAALADLRSEAALRLDALRSPPGADAVPAALVRLAPHERHALVVDTQRARVFVYRNAGGAPELVADFYASHGKQGAAKLREGDKRTPVGVYRVAGRLEPDDLTDFYGAGAFPITYPNALDRREGRDGFGIWLHGSPRDTYARAPRASDGCVVLANDDLRALAAFVDGGTPVVIEDGVRLVSRASLAAERDALERAVESWRSDWQRRDVERYLAHYAAGFASDEGWDRARWAKHKTRVIAARSSIEVGVDGLSIQRSGDDVAVVSFEQRYRSDALDGTMHKRQYWVREQGAWRIAWEGDARNDLGRPMRTRAQLLSLQQDPPPARAPTSP